MFVNIWINKKQVELFSQLKGRLRQKFRCAMALTNKRVGTTAESEELKSLKAMLTDRECHLLAHGIAVGESALDNEENSRFMLMVVEVEPFQLEFPKVLMPMPFLQVVTDFGDQTVVNRMTTQLCGLLSEGSKYRLSRDLGFGAAVVLDQDLRSNVRLGGLITVLPKINVLQDRINTFCRFARTLVEDCRLKVATDGIQVVAEVEGEAVYDLGKVAKVMHQFCKASHDHIALINVTGPTRLHLGIAIGLRHGKVMPFAAGSSGMLILRDWKTE